MKTEKTITEREYLDYVMQMLAGDSANPYGNAEQRVSRVLEKADLALKTLGYTITKD